MFKGEDIRKGCSEGTLDVYRFVCNGIYPEQTRTYDIVALPRRGDFQMTVRLRGTVDLTFVL